MNNSTQVALSFANADDLANTSNIRMGVGYYGASSDNAGQRFWTLLVNNPPTDNFTFLRTAVPITNGVPVLAVLRIQFGVTDQIDLFINPAIGGAAPATPSASRSTSGGANILFRTLGFWTSANNSNASIDEIRLGDSFLAVTPTNAPVIAPGTIQFSGTNFSANEDSGIATITATRLNGTLGAVSVDYATDNGTATAGNDYTSTTGTLQWADGDATNKTFTINIANDSLVESNETVNLLLSNPTGATLGTPSAAILAINDNDGITSLVISNHSFEFPAIATGTFMASAAPPGWSVYGNGINFNNRAIGVLDVIFLLDNPGNQTNFGSIEAGMQQTLSSTLQTERIYTLRVEVGNIAPDNDAPFQFADFPNYRIDLLAGTNVLASDLNTLLPGEGLFLSSTVTAVIGTTHPFAGQALGIRLMNLDSAPGIEVNWDNVRLEAGPLPSLLISQSGDSVQLSWPAVATGFTLQTATNLTTPMNWQPAGISVIQTNGQFHAAAPVTSGREQFFRLRIP